MFILCDGSGARPDETDLGQILALDLSSHQVLRRFLGLAGEDRRQTGPVPEMILKGMRKPKFGSKAEPQGAPAPRKLKPPTRPSMQQKNTV